LTLRNCSGNHPIVSWRQGRREGGKEAAVKIEGSRAPTPMREHLVCGAFSISDDR
jgi:hypothetical protein